MANARLIASANDIAAADWDACAGTANPFVSHAFISALEESGSAGAAAGWGPAHLVVDDAGGATACFFDARAHPLARVEASRAARRGAGENDASRDGSGFS